MSGNYSLFRKLETSYKKAYPFKSGLSIQKEVTELWNGMKSSVDVKQKVEERISKLESIARERKAKLFGFWSNFEKHKKILPLDSSLQSKPSICLNEECGIPDRPSTSGNNEAPVLPIHTKTIASKGHATPVQDRIREIISTLEADLNLLYKKEKTGLCTIEQQKEIVAKEKELQGAKRKLVRKVGEQKRQNKRRKEIKRNLEEACIENPELKKKLKIRGQVGQPRAETDQPDLLKTIVNIAQYGCAADDKRRTEALRSVKTLDDLAEELRKMNYNISRSGIYLRLLPRCSASTEGKRHVQTVPVKLARSEKSTHATHPDAAFCTSSIRYLEELSSVLGPQEVLFVSQDDKARVAIGITAATKQSPLLMHVDYRVSLPDHDWVVADRHKLIPSVYAPLVIEPNKIGSPEAVTYSGPTYIAIRSGKHSSSTAFSHSMDFHRMLELEEFSDITKTRDGTIKPVLIFTVDGGPDENPRYSKVIDVAIQHYTEFKLGALFIATNAPGRSAFNRVERRMAPLSHDLAGLILPHEHFGTHLDKNGKTIDAELEKINFGFAGETLATVWSGTVVDGYPVVAKYCAPESSELLPDIKKDAGWKLTHVCESQYMLQVVKCNDTRCCQPPRSSYFSIVRNRFLPPPIKLQQTNNGLVACDLGSESTGKFASLFLRFAIDPSDVLPRSCSQYKKLPYDLYCPSLRKTLSTRCCKKCELYHGSLVSLRNHLKHCCTDHSMMNAVQMKRPVRVAARRQRELMIIIKNELNAEDVEWCDEDEVDLSQVQDVVGLPLCAEEGNLPILDLKSHFTSPWE